jgi:phospholipid transport system substrate-binding protein
MKPRSNSPARRRRTQCLLALGAVSVAWAVFGRTAAGQLPSSPAPVAPASSGAASSSAGASVAARDARGEVGAPTPEAAVEQLYRGLEEAARGDLDVDERYRRLEPVVAATHDLPFIAELTIRRQWEALTPQERERFVDAFRRLSVMTYASRFGTLEEGMFKITGSGDTGNGRAEVESTLTTRKGDVIPFQYLLHETAGGWKIINILADNVSDLALKRAEYRDVLENGSVDELIRHLEQQAEETAKAGQVRYR